MRVVCTTAIVAFLSLSAAGAQQPVVQLDPHGRDSIRVRIAPPGGAIVDNAFAPYAPPPPPAARVERASSSSLSNGNLLVAFDAATGFITASRVSDGAPLLSTAALAFGPPANGSRAGSVSASISLAVAGGAANRLYGLGEHTTGQLDVTGYAKKLETSQYYGVSHGADILIPFYMAHPLGLGVLWAASSYGEVSLQPAAHNWTSYATLNIDLWLTTTPAPMDYPPATADPAANGPMAQMLSNYVDAVGHAPPMPSYVAGFWACKVGRRCRRARAHAHTRTRAHAHTRTRAHAHTRQLTTPLPRAPTHPLSAEPLPQPDAGARRGARLPRPRAAARHSHHRLHALVAMGRLVL